MKNDEVRDTLDQIGWNALRLAAHVDPVTEGASGAKIFKLGHQSIIEPEATVYQRLRAQLGEAADVLFPRTSFTRIPGVTVHARPQSKI